MTPNRLSKFVGLAVALAAVALAVGTAQTREAVPPAETVEAAATAVEVAPECADASPAEATFTSGDAGASLTEDSSSQDAACKPCKDRTWCKCTYNGMARASCDPCCYRNNIGVLTCLD